MRQAKPPSGRNYAELVKVIGVVASVEQFWQLYSCLKRPAEHTTSCDYHVFRYGVKPMWEDPANAQGGKWFVRMRPEVSNRVWESAVRKSFSCAFCYFLLFYSATPTTKTNKTS